MSAMVEEEARCRGQARRILVLYSGLGWLTSRVCVAITCVLGLLVPDRAKREWSVNPESVVQEPQEPFSVFNSIMALHGVCISVAKNTTPHVTKV